MARPVIFKVDSLMTRRVEQVEADPRHVSLVALPDAVISTLTGIFDVLNAFSVMNLPVPKNPFKVEIVGESAGPMPLASGVPVSVQREISDIRTTDIVIVPSILLSPDGWTKGRYPGLVDWLKRMHQGGAVLCSACSGVFLLAETDLYFDRDATVHFGYAQAFERTHPTVRIHPERVLTVSGDRDELICSGASMSWHDLALYLIARFVGATAAHEIARAFALQWHQEGLTPYMVFAGRRDHGDAEIEDAQKWLVKNFTLAQPVEEMIKRSRLAERTFKRRFTQATGFAPLVYVQRLRVEDAKRRLERTDTAIDEISWQVGYEDPAFFRRLFKRTTGLAPGAYRKRFRIPDFARS